MQYTIRPMHDDDWKYVEPIYQQGINSNIATLVSSCPSYEQWDRSHLQVCRLVVLENDKIIGWAALMPFSPRPSYSGVAELSIYIDRSSQHRGAGLALMRALIETSESSGIWSLQSMILRENHPSIRLHEKCGFRVVGHRSRLGKDRFGAWRDLIIMERRSPRDDF